MGFFKYIGYYNYPPRPYSAPTQTGSHYAILINNGLWYQVSRTALLGMDIGLGFQRRNTERSPYHDQSNGLKLSANISAGFQF
jgi:hypothetical protein